MLQGDMQALREELYNYFGALNEIKAGLKPAEMPEKPEALVYYDMIRMLGIPLVAGGVLDQPHIWLSEYIVCDQVTQLFDVLNARADGQKAGGVDGNQSTF